MKLEDLKGFSEEQMEQIKKVVQGETDRVRTDYTTKIKELEQYKPVDKTPQEIALEERLKALEDKEKEIANKERQSQLQSKLQEKGLDSKLVKWVRFDDENFDTQLDEFANVMNNMLLDGSYKPSTHVSNKDIITKEQFAEMGYSERSNLMENNPTLYAKLSE